MFYQRDKEVRQRWRRVVIPPPPPPPLAALFSPLLSLPFVSLFNPSRSSPSFCRTDVCPPTLHSKNTMRCSDMLSCLDLLTYTELLLSPTTQVRWLNDSCLMGQRRKHRRDAVMSWWRYTEHLTTTTDQLFLLREDVEDERKEGRKEEGGWKEEEEEEETIFSVEVCLNIPRWIPPFPRRRRGSWLLCSFSSCCHYSSQFLNVCFSVWGNHHVGPHHSLTSDLPERSHRSSTRLYT